MRRANDAGEPSGSAGAPILAAIEGAGITDCIVIVTRWYGGTKLGVGGLVRAYGDAAARALEAAPRRIGVEAARLAIQYPYAHTAAVMRAMERAGAEEVEHGYAASGDAGIVEIFRAGGRGGRRWRTSCGRGRRGRWRRSGRAIAYFIGTRIPDRRIPTQPTPRAACPRADPPVLPAVLPRPVRTAGSP